jgi:hypothetical protein
VARLNLMRQKHNILLVTNDHVEVLTSMADNIITVSAVDRNVVQINDRFKMDRAVVIAALSVGDKYVFEGSSADIKFFMDVEVFNNGGIFVVFCMTVFLFGLFLLSFWNSAEESASLVLIASGILAHVAMDTFQLTHVDWRNFMTEEAEALLHSSKSMNKVLRTCLSISIMLTISLVEYGMLNAVISGLEDIKFWIAILFDSASTILPYIYLSLYTTLPFQTVATVAWMPFLFTLFFSTTFSPGKTLMSSYELMN